MIEIRQDENWFKLNIVNYEVPDTDNKDYDGNWLFVHIDVQKDNLHWSHTSSALLTWEAEQIIRWFSYLAKGIQPQKKDINLHFDPQDEYAHRLAVDLDFTEPNLAFEYHPTDTGIHLKIKFELEFLPVHWEEWDDDEECSIEFDLTYTQVAEVANMFRDELKKFPPRV